MADTRVNSSMQLSKLPCKCPQQGWHQHPALHARQRQRLMRRLATAERPESDAADESGVVGDWRAFRASLVAQESCEYTGGSLEALCVYTLCYCRLMVCTQSRCAREDCRYRALPL